DDADTIADQKQKAADLLQRTGRVKEAAKLQLEAAELHSSSGDAGGYLPAEFVHFVRLGLGRVQTWRSQVMYGHVWAAALQLAARAPGAMSLDGVEWGGARFKLLRWEGKGDVDAVVTEGTLPQLKATAEPAEPG